MLLALFDMVMLTSIFKFLKALSGISVKALPERLRLTYLPADVIALAMFGSIGPLAFIVTLIGLSGVLAGCLSRYAFNSSALFRLLPLLPVQDAIEKIRTTVKAATMALTLLFIKETPTLKLSSMPILRFEVLPTAKLHPRHGNSALPGAYKKAGVCPCGHIRPSSC
jgi:hypothetical protein